MRYLLGVLQYILVFLHGFTGFKSVALRNPYLSSQARPKLTYELPTFDILHCILKAAY